MIEYSILAVPGDAATLIKYVYKLSRTNCEIDPVSLVPFPKIEIFRQEMALKGSSRILARYSDQTNGKVIHY
jgi:hypothetical protein